jgi:hypothetical protein
LKKLRRILLIVVVIISIVFVGTYSLGFANAMPLPPKISILSPKNQEIYTNDVPLTFTAQTYGRFDTDGRKDGWGIVSFSYSLDNQDNVTLGISNATLTNLSQGQHSVVIYAEREWLLNGFLSTGLRDNFSSSEIYFIVNPLPSTISSTTPTSTPTSDRESSLTEPFPTVPVAAVSVAVAVVVVAVVSLLLFRRHRKAIN